MKQYFALVLPDLTSYKITKQSNLGAVNVSVNADFPS